jgi:hypothetical protein
MMKMTLKNRMQIFANPVPQCRETKKYFFLPTLFFIFFILAFLQGCKQENTPKKKSGQASTQKPNTTPTFASEEIYWFTSIKVNDTITLNKTEQNSVYLRGEKIHTFLTSTHPSGGQTILPRHNIYERSIQTSSHEGIPYLHYQFNHQKN